MKVLSLFDGIACGRVALERAGIKVDKYFASEIKQFAMDCAKKNNPDIIHIGDVTKVSYEDGVLHTENGEFYVGEIDLLIGGSPCQDFSTAASVWHKEKNGQYGLDGDKSSLFYEYLRLKEEINPTYFLLENVKMKKDSEKELNEYMGVEGIHINSNLVSYQTRNRIYWTNIPNVTIPEDRKINFQDYKDNDQSRLEEAKTNKTPSRERMWNDGKGKAGLRSCSNITHSNKVGCLTRKQDRCPNSGLIEYKDFCRFLTRRELELDQTLPAGYCDCLSYNQVQDVTGDGWTVDVIAWIFSFLKKDSEEKENKQMELKMNEYQLPEQILFNYEELKQELTEKVAMYETLVYTDDQIKEAKADKANLNKLKKALNDERIRREKEYMVPFNDFKTKINEIISIIDKPVAVIDKQVKAYEDKQKQDKMDEIKAYWDSLETPEGLALEEIFDSKWLNASVSMKSIQVSIDTAIEKFNQDMATLANLPEFGFEAQQEYIRTLDINKAIAEGHRMSEIAKAKAQREEAMRKIEEEQKAKAAEVAAVVPEPQIVEEAPAKQWIAFQALLSTNDAIALRNFFADRNIEFKAV